MSTATSNSTISSVFERIEAEYQKLRNEIFAKNPNIADQEPENSYILLIAKLIENLRAAAILARSGLIADTSLILRSAFESLILLKLFIYYPEPLKIWEKLGTEIADFEHKFILNQQYPDRLSTDSLKTYYEKLSQDAQKELGPFDRNAS